MTGRPHIPDDVVERVEKFKEIHKNSPKYKIYSEIIRYFIDTEGRWKSDAPDGLKETLGREIAV